MITEHVSERLDMYVFTSVLSKLPVRVPIYDSSATPLDLGIVPECISDCSAVFECFLCMTKGSKCIYKTCLLFS
jgi:hypothetical protein